MHLMQADLFETPMAEVLPGVSPAPAPSETSGLAFFAAWRAARLLDGHRKPMGAVGLGQAQFVWGKWLAFCSGRGLAWQRALPADVRAFAATLSPRRLGTTLAVSPVTLRRYWRILNDLYAHALLTGLVEIMALTLGSVEAHAGSPQEVAERLALAGLPLLQPESAFWTPLSSRSTPALPSTYALQLSGPHPVQRRRLVLDARTSNALADYLEVRRLGKAAPQDRLIVGNAEGAALTARSLYGIGQAHIARCLHGRALAQTGPNTLRNSCIACWLRQGVALAEVLRRCGLKNTQLLIRLQRHLNPQVALSTLGARRCKAATQGKAPALGKPAQHHRIGHALAKRCHEVSPWKRGTVPTSKVSPQCRSRQAPHKPKTHCKLVRISHRASGLVQQLILSNQ